MISYNMRNSANGDGKVLCNYPDNCSEKYDLAIAT